ncbi:kanamycin nucleotidyltransferase C-terminal domain-containing protein [Effusibacillus pohliae]|uniref:kanamycin nucleotidyltransferase C-terminal domain-containing protein n=1 Tax=Effusibacillus pohliae TaxID=232270 RepID=UPI00036DADDE|nr:kanamycin nucleotidyltransferase C-terminal domain-containing protein [Effusibacillus pohliae]
MQHGDRIKVVRGIHIRVQHAYKNSILFGGVYGSTAIGRDTEFSDIEMMYVVKEGGPQADKTFLYRGIPIEVNLLPIARIHRRLAEPDLQLPWLMGNLAALQLLAGEEKQRRELLDTYSRLPDAAIARFFLAHGAEIAYESFNKIRSLPRRGNTRERELFVYEVVREIALALALLNRRPITRGYYAAVKESYEFPHIPEAYRELTETFIRAEEVKEAIEAGQNLLASYERFLQERGICVPRVETLDEVAW